MNKIYEWLLFKIYWFYRNRTEKLERKYAKELWIKTRFDTDVDITSKPEIINKRGLITGKNLKLGKNVVFNAEGGILIGDNVTIGDDVKILSIYKNNGIVKPIILFDSVFVGDNAVIYPGEVIVENVNYGEIVNNKTNALNPILKNLDPLKYQDIEDVIFVLSTGRAGSKSIQEVFKGCNGIQTYHESLYMFLETLSLRYLSGKISREQVKKALILYFSFLPQLKFSGIYLESDQKLVPFFDIIHEIFPKSKFIWLVREPHSFLKSAFSRGWFNNDYPILVEDNFVVQPEFPSRGMRITGDLAKEYTQKDWLELDRQLKIIWYWYYWNRLIQKHFKVIENSQKLIIKTDEINTNTKKLLDFVGIENKNIEPVHINKVKKKHKAEYNKFTVSPKAESKLKEAKDFFQNLDNL